MQAAKIYTVKWYWGYEMTVSSQGVEKKNWGRDSGFYIVPEVLGFGEFRSMWLTDFGLALSLSGCVNLNNRAVLEPGRGRYLYCRKPPEKTPSYMLGIPKIACLDSGWMTLRS